MSVALTSDADFTTGSRLVLTNGSLIYTPGTITAAKVGSDTLKYTVTDTVTGAVTTETQAVTLNSGPTPTPAPRGERDSQVTSGQNGARKARLSTFPEPVFGNSVAKLTDLGTL